jgi:hypothetical protein
MRGISVRNLTVFLVGLAGGYVAAMQLLPTPMGRVAGRAARPRLVEATTSDSVAVEQAVPQHSAWSAAASREYARIYGRLGIEPGDTVQAVNDVKVPEGYLRLVSAYDAGRVCVDYDRARAKRRVCLIRDAGGERVEDGAR